MEMNGLLLTTNSNKSYPSHLPPWWQKTTLVNTLAPDSCEHCLPLVDWTFKLSTRPLTLQLHSTVRVPLHEHNFSQYGHI